MVFREVSVIEIREVLRSRLAGAGLRTVAAPVGVDHKTTRRYVEAAVSGCALAQLLAAVGLILHSCPAGRTGRLQLDADVLDVSPRSCRVVTGS
jgi:hypothetical protein